MPISLTNTKSRASTVSVNSMAVATSLDGCPAALPDALVARRGLNLDRAAVAATSEMDGAPGGVGPAEELLGWAGTGGRGRFKRTFRIASSEGPAGVAGAKDETGLA